MDGQDNRLLLERYLAGLLDPEQEYVYLDKVIDRTIRLLTENSPAFLQVILVS